MSSLSFFSVMNCFTKKFSHEALQDSVQNSLPCICDLCSFICQKYKLASLTLNPIALRKAKIVCNFGISECNRVKAQQI